MLGNGLHAVFALVLREDVSVTQRQLAIGSCLQKRKRERDERKEKANELQQNVRVKLKTH